MAMAAFAQAGAAAYPDEAFTPTPFRLIATAQAYPKEPAYSYFTGKEWRVADWSTYLEEIRQAARALLALGVGAGDTVCILGFNRPEWTIAAHAAMMIGAAPAGIYFTSSAEEIEYILNHAQAPVLIAETAGHFARVKRFETELFCLKKVVMMEGAAATDPLQIGWRDFLLLGRQGLQQQVEQRLADLKPQACGMRIYTSGTTGPPKAVVLSHGALSWTSWTLKGMFGNDSSHRVLSYLPLAHIAEASNSIHNHALGGYLLTFARSLEGLGDDLKHVRPTIFFGVPRVWQKIHETLVSRLSEAPASRRRLVSWALRVGRRAAQQRLRWGLADPVTAVQAALAERLVLRRIREAIGLDQCQLAVSGAAPIPREVLEFFAGIGLVIFEVYGQSEDCGPTTFNRPGAVKLGSVGKPIPGMELKIAEDGEILIRAPSLFDGYAKDAAATRAVLDDGWMRTGDLGSLDRKGYLTITGRKKDILITSGGKNIAPANLESDLMMIPQVEHAVVCGEGRNYLTALLTLKPEFLAPHIARPRARAAAALDDSELVAAIQPQVDAINARYARAESIRKFAILPSRFGLESGELTPTLKVKRAFVTRKFAHIVDELYSAPNSADA
jgi:long-chain acyl-CoA synthetase